MYLLYPVLCYDVRMMTLQAVSAGLSVPLLAQTRSVSRLLVEDSYDQLNAGVVFFLRL